MPELPEVETIRCGLQKKLVGQKIESVIIRETRMRVPVDERKLFSELPGQTFLEIGRRSKYLLLHLTKDKILMVHLGMSGRVVLQATDEDFRKHDHIILNLVGGQQFRFHDPRRFGLVELVDASKLQQHVRIKNLGLEPLDNTTTSEVTWIKISTSKKPIKSLLMDANFIVGVGNIYANEALFLAGIHPGKIANSLTRKEWDLLLHQVKLVLHKAIEQGERHSMTLSTVPVRWAIFSRSSLCMGGRARPASAVIMKSCV